MLALADRLLQKVQVAVTEKAEARALAHTPNAQSSRRALACAFTDARCAVSVRTAQRHERDTWLAKNQDKIAREQTLAALAADREERRQKAERAAEAALARPAAASPAQLPPPA